LPQRPPFNPVVVDSSHGSLSFDAFRSRGPLDPPARTNAGPFKWRGERAPRAHRAPASTAH
ncbi:MAG: hypothetical protein WA761_01295, partial [Thermoplasmata archaeon]